MSAMSLITLGGTMNKMASIADGLWGIRYDKLPVSLKVYAVGDIKFGHMAYSVLVGALLREIFPDPDIACKMTGCSQQEFVTWFNQWVTEVLYGTDLDELEASYSTNRQELVASIKYRNEYGDRSSETPMRVQFMAKFLHWPTITSGGPRYLQLVRLKFLEHYVMLRHSSVSGARQIFVKMLTESDIKYATFGHKFVGDLDGSVPMRRDTRETLALACHPALEDTLIKPDINDLCLPQLCRAAGAAGRDLPEALLEWMRLDVLHVNHFFNACCEDPQLAKAFRSKYETYRLLYFRTVNLRPRPVKFLEESVEKENRAVLDQVDARIEKLRKELEYCQTVKKKIQSVDDEDVPMDRLFWKEWAIANKPGKAKVSSESSSVSTDPSSQRVVSRGSGSSRSDRMTNSPHQGTVRSVHDRLGLDRASGSKGGSRRGGLVSRSYRTSASSQSVPSAKRDRSWSRHRDNHRAPPPKRGRPLAVKLSEFEGVPDQLGVDLSGGLNLQEADENSTGGRLSRNKKKKKKSSETRVVRLLTQDEIEEDNNLDFEFRGPEPDFNYEFDLDD